MLHHLQIMRNYNNAVAGKAVSAARGLDPEEAAPAYRRSKH
jgi:hypothetical protein